MPVGIKHYVIFLKYLNPVDQVRRHKILHRCTYDDIALNKCCDRNGIPNSNKKLLIGIHLF